MPIDYEKRIREAFQSRKVGKGFCHSLSSSVIGEMCVRKSDFNRKTYTHQFKISTFKNALSDMEKKGKIFRVGKTYYGGIEWKLR